MSNCRSVFVWEHHGAVRHRSHCYLGRFSRPSARLDLPVHQRDVERFSYYGMRALLVLYMVKYLLLPGHDDVIGFGVVRGALESIFGPLGVQPFASQIYGLYTGFVYLTPLFRGWLADHVLGQRRTVILGAGRRTAIRRLDGGCSPISLSSPLASSISPPSACHWFQKSRRRA